MFVNKRLRIFSKWVKNAENIMGFDIRDGRAGEREGRSNDHKNQTYAKLVTKKVFTFLQTHFVTLFVWRKNES